MNNIIMCRVWTIRSRRQHDDIYVCDYCFRRVVNNNIKKSFIVVDDPKNIILIDKMTCAGNYKRAYYTKCFSCKRLLYGIVNGPDIIKFIRKIKNKTDLYMLLEKISVWYYNYDYDKFGKHLRSLGFDKETTKNIYHHIKELQALPADEIINNRLNDLVIAIGYENNNENLFINY